MTKKGRDDADPAGALRRRESDVLRELRELGGQRIAEPQLENAADRPVGRREIEKGTGGAKDR